jgi:2'-5' RNA ligase
MPEELRGADQTFPSAGRCLNSFALVTYLPDPLQRFLNDLRVSLEPVAASPRAHVTVLSPRSLVEGASLADAHLHLTRTLPRLGSFEIAVGEISVFPDSRVIYLELEAGWDELAAMHRELNQGALHAPERFPFHPHVTLAQNIPATEVDGLSRVAADVWNSYDGRRSFLAENFTLVRDTAARGWLDVQEYSLAPAAVPLTRF